MPFFYSFVAQFFLNGNFNHLFAGDRFIVRFICRFSVQWIKPSPYPVYSGSKNRDIFGFVSVVYALNRLAGRKQYEIIDRTG